MTNHCMDLKHQLCHKPHISLNRSRRSGLLNVSGWLLWIHLINKMIIKRQRNLLRLFGFFLPTGSKGKSSQGRREEMARLPVGNWIVHFQLNVTWKIHWGVSGNLSQTNMSPGTEAFYSLLIYTKHFFPSCLVLQIGPVGYCPPPFRVKTDNFCYHVLVWHPDRSLLSGWKLARGSLRWEITVKKWPLKARGHLS